MIERWRSLSARSKVAGVLVVVVAIAATAIAMLLQRDSRVALFSQSLRPEQVAEVVERLAEWNVAFVATADNVRVDVRKRNELLLRLSLAGVPRPYVASSSDLLDKAGPLTPSPVLEAEARAGLAGDIELALRGVAGIEEARVIVAPARPGTFADDATHDASASVRLSLRAGAAAPRDLIAAVRGFVAAAVPGLDAKHVTVLDDRGLVLGDRSQGVGEQGPALEASLQSALDAAFGLGATIVRVRVALDARAREVREIRREPLAKGAIASTRIDERYYNEKKRYTKLHSSDDRGSDVREEHMEIAPGAPERISVAVLVDAARKVELAKVRSIAGATVGLAPERGDRLSVESLAFVHPPIERLSRAATTLGYASTVAPIFAILVAALVALRWSMKPVLAAVDALTVRSMVQRTAEAASNLAPGQVHGALSGEPPHVAAAVIAALPAPVATAVLELYDTHERAAIVARLARVLPPVARDVEALLRRG